MKLSKRKIQDGALGICIKRELYSIGKKGLKAAVGGFPSFKPLRTRLTGTPKIHQAPTIASWSFMR